jgi:hypothetical protein
MRLETIPEMRGEGIKENDGRGWIQLWYIVRIFVNVTRYIQYNNNKREEKKKSVTIFTEYLIQVGNQ